METKNATIVTASTGVIRRFAVAIVALEFSNLKHRGLAARAAQFQMFAMPLRLVRTLAFGRFYLTVGQ